MKPGYQTSEFWMHAGVQLAGLLVLTGFVSSSDAAKLTDGWAQCVTAIFTIIAQVLSAVQYLKSRHILKSQAAAAGTTGALYQGEIGGSTAVKSIIAIFAVLLLSAPSFAQAQAPKSQIPPYTLPWRAWVHGQLAATQTPAAPAPTTDPAMVALFQIHLNQQQKIIDLLSQQHAAPAPAPAPAPLPPIAYAPPGTIHYYPVPPGVQQYPLAPPVAPQVFPVAPPVAPQVFPVAPPVAPQVMPVAPPVAPQVMPIAPPVAPQVLPMTPPIPVPIPPLTQPQQPPVAPAPTGYQRFTHALAR
jgi:hypothetical protein